MSKFKNAPIKYTSRDFNSIKSELVDYAKRYYPNTYKDFTQASFGSMVLDLVSYVGDVLSFYVDYQANESFLDTALEYDNVIKHGKQLGFKFNTNPSSYGEISLFILVPAASDSIGPDKSYTPILKRGSTFSTDDGNVFTLIEDVDFGKNLNEVVAATVDETTGAPLMYAVKSQGIVQSGELFEQITTIGAFEKFLRIELSDDNITEIVSVYDSEGSEYFEVDYLSQNVIYKDIVNADSNTKGNPHSIIRPVAVPRRFVVDSDLDGVFLQFGQGLEQSELGGVLDPSQVVLQLNGRNYITDSSFDPNKMSYSDKLGVVPSNTEITITYRKNTSDAVNAASNSIVNPEDTEFFFRNEELLAADSITDVQTSLECANEEPITGDISFPETDEVKIRIMNTFAAQNRAVTAEDYVSLIYQMPSKFGSIKRTRVMRDPDSIYRNINIYTISEDEEGLLAETNKSIKENLKVWISNKKMINDTVDILDAKIVNYGINFSILANKGLNRFDVLEEAIQALIDKFGELTLDIGEPLFITDIYNVLNDLEGVIDTVDVRLTPKTGGVYSDLEFSFDANMSNDGRFLKVPKNVIMELKYPTLDIKGVVK
jgi:uncharacterized protein YrrD